MVIEFSYVGEWNTASGWKFVILRTIDAVHCMENQIYLQLDSDSQ